MLDRTEQRIVGVLLEKEATVPDIYPLSENALQDGCNQKNNRDPVMALEQFMIAGALMALQEKDWVARIDGHGRVTKFRHKVVERLGLTPPEVAVLCELLLRGPQAPGALKPRVARLGFVAEPAQIDALLHKMATRPQPLVERLPLQPRERDARWRHLLGPMEATGSESGARSLTEAGGAVIALRPTPLPEPAPARVPAADLEARVAALEAEVKALREEVARWRSGG